MYQNDHIMLYLSVFEMMVGLTKGGNLRNVKTHNVILANQKTELYYWLGILLMLLPFRICRGKGRHFNMIIITLC